MGKLLPVSSGLEPILQKLIGVMTYTNEWLKISSDSHSNRCFSMMQSLSRKTCQIDAICQTIIGTTQLAVCGEVMSHIMLMPSKSHWHIP